MKFTKTVSAQHKTRIKLPRVVFFLSTLREKTQQITKWYLLRINDSRVFKYQAPLLL